MLRTQKQTLILAALLSSTEVSCHMPNYPSGQSDPNNPIDLGDITENSWAVADEIGPDEVHYYKFNIESTTNGDPINEKFWMGLYVPPGEKEEDFTFFTAIWGLSEEIGCERWPGGWGRRLDYVEGDEEHTHDNDNGSKTYQAYNYGRTFINDDSAIIADRNAIPDRVFDRKYMDVLIFEASSELDIPPKFEPFLPTVFQPRGSCVAQFPRTGEYYIAVWAADGTKRPHKYSVGLGLKERDVFAFQNLILADFNLLPMYMWNHWNPIVIFLPIILSLILCQIFFYKSRSKPYLFQWLVSSAASIYIGHAIFNIINLMWCLSIADPHGEQSIAIVAGIILPIVNGILALVAANMCQSGDQAKCCKDQGGCRNVCRRLTSLITGIFHLFGWHAGYVVAPVTLIVSSLLPGMLADRELSICGKKEDADSVKVKDSPNEQELEKKANLME